MSYNRELLNGFLKRRHVLFGGLFSTGLSQDETEKREEFLKNQGLYIEDKWERMKRIFKQDDFGNYHPEMLNAISKAQVGALVGILLGGTLRHLRTMHDYERNNDASLFTNKREAHLSLVRYNTVNFVRGGLVFAPIFGLFVGSFNLFSSCIQAYRNKSGVIEYTIGGAAAGALFRIHFGPMGIFIGGVVGTILGTIYGFVQLILLNMLQVNQIDLKYANYTWQNSKQKYDFTKEKMESILRSDSEPNIDKNDFQETINNKQKQFEDSK